MSGFEIVGVVLGGIPLIISALEHYQSLQIWRRSARELKSLVVQLTAQHSILKNTCSMLLEDIVDAHKIGHMTTDPFGSLWHVSRSPKSLWLNDLTQALY
jgi:hypothetical protein